MNRPFLVAAALAVPFIAPGCNTAPPSGPPELRFGRDLCIHCGMVIVDERAAAAIRAPGLPADQPPVYDDIGCLVDHLGKSGLTPTEAWVKDYATKEWIQARQATFLLADAIETPMGSGLAAYATPEAARAAGQPLSAEVLTWDELAPRRKRWRHERFGTPLE